ncbi:transcriptional regulator, AraC family, putative [gamma proteobacterium HTCC5015]|nr:transcriptional regulator, AraC family, putative [gamma proteobacterium HTCC5015]
MSSADKTTKTTAQQSVDTLRIPSLLVPSIIKFAIRMRVDFADALNSASVDPALDNLVEETISVQQFVGLIEALTQKLDLPTVGLYFGESFAFDYIPEMETFLSTCQTPRQALRVLKWATPLLAPFVTLDLKEDDSQSMVEGIVDVDSLIPHEAKSVVVEALFAVVNKFARVLIGESFTLEGVYFSHDLLGTQEEYEDVFRCAVSGGCDYNRMIISQAVLDMQLQSSMPQLNRQAQEMLERRLEKFNSALLFSERVYSLMYQSPELLTAGLEEVASEFNMTGRTLQRRLQQEELNFQQVVDRARFKRACDLLHDPNSSIEQISDALGFSDRRSFTRSFSRWSGLTPSQYRKMMPTSRRTQKASS